ncbi:MAG: biotin/lipoyl-binding protein, partial [Roseiflexaceae bacterium]|nr:biotin/lipoyl-binding protein [Roseiflexaceae bacterium]
ADIEDAQFAVDVISTDEQRIALAFHQLTETFTYAQAGPDRLLHWHGRVYALALPAVLDIDVLGAAVGAAGVAGLESPMPGTVVKLLVRAGEHVVAGQPLVVIEAMKMEHTVSAPHAGTVARLPFAAGALVPKGAALAEITHL